MSAEPAPEEELRRLERHYSVNPEGLVFARLADAYRRCGHLDRSLDLLREGLERHPDYAAAHLIEGRTLREAGRPDDAAEAFRRALDLDTENRAALRSLAELAGERGEAEEARRWARRLKSLDPGASIRSPEASESSSESAPDDERTPEGGSRESASGAALPAPDDADREGESGLPGDEGLASEIAAMADEQWWSSSEESGEGDGSKMATETMARLYAQQGLYEQAADVYGRLAQRRPDDDDLRLRREEMERRARGDVEETSGGDGDGPSAGGERPTESGGPAETEVVSAREHFRALLRGHADVPGESSGASGEPEE